MRKRLQEFALSLHSEKTRLIEFGRFAAANRKRRGLSKPETFTFLGFTFICSKTRRGKFQIRRKSRRDRMQAKLQAIKQELRRSMHQPIPQQGRWLQQVVTGYFNYHAVPTNSPTLTAFLFHVTNLWRRTLRQRSQKDWTTWERIKRLADDWLPQPRILHPWPARRFAVRHPRWEPYARIGPVRICAGGRSVMSVPTAISETSAQQRAATTQTPRRPIGAGGVRGASRAGSASVITTHALFARKVQRKPSNGVAGFAAGRSSSDRRRDRGQFVPCSATPHDGQRLCRTLAEDPAKPSPMLRIPNAAAQTRVVSMAGIRLGSWESARSFKAIMCDDISEFESHMPSQAVRSPPADIRA